MNRRVALGVLLVLAVAFLVGLPSSAVAGQKGEVSHSAEEGYYGAAKATLWTPFISWQSGTTTKGALHLLPWPQGSGIEFGWRQCYPMPAPRTYYTWDEPQATSYNVVMVQLDTHQWGTSHLYELVHHNSWVYPHKWTLYLDHNGVVDLYAFNMQGISCHAENETFYAGGATSNLTDRNYTRVADFQLGHQESDGTFSWGSVTDGRVYHDLPHFLAPTFWSFYDDFLFKTDNWFN
jgi:hypothetical protein